MHVIKLFLLLQTHEFLLWINISTIDCRRLGGYRALYNNVAKGPKTLNTALSAIISFSLNVLIIIELNCWTELQQFQSKCATTIGLNSFAFLWTLVVDIISRASSQYKEATEQLWRVMEIITLDKSKDRQLWCVEKWFCDDQQFRRSP